MTDKLDPAAHTLLTVPKRLARQKADPWEGFAGLRQHLPALEAKPEEKPRRSSSVVTARKPARRTRDRKEA